ncbi:MAG: hypothetical protein KDD45_09395, partial [Bdellovibrionales bacterium]|nr:hypothetical protein [Bdellovibrionales bacterium]
CLRKSYWALIALALTTPPRLLMTVYPLKSGESSRLMDLLEANGVIGPARGAEPRKVIDG